MIEAIRAFLFWRLPWPPKLPKFLFGTRSTLRAEPEAPAVAPTAQVPALLPDTAGHEPIIIRKAVSKVIAKLHSHGARRPAKEVLGFKRTILDQLDDNTKILARMKACFPMEYGLYSQIGAVVIPHDDPFIDCDALTDCPVSAWFNKVRPSFGAVVSGDPYDAAKGKDDPLEPRLMHFIKIKHPREIKKRLFERHGRDIIQPIGMKSDLYIFTNYYDQRDWARVFPRKTREDRNLARFFEKAFAIELPLEITEDGRVRPLKILRELRAPRPFRLTRGENILTRTWDYPYSKACMKGMSGEAKNMAPQDYILCKIGLALRCYEEATSSIIQVRATKNGVCTLINVNVEETPDFFEDREDVIVDGIKKRIFHIVRPHERVTRNHTALVHLHFRGLRQFVWNGYEIEISVPGRDHFLLNEVDIPTTEESDPAVASGYELPQVASWLVANQKGRFAAMVGQRGPHIPLENFGRRYDRGSPQPPA
jgi:hypothetical protein